MQVAMTRGANLRGVFPVPARSHLILQKTLMFQLARRGHEVTDVSSFPENKAIPNYTDIEFKTSMKDLLESAGKGVERDYYRLNGVRGKRWYILIHFNIVLCKILRLRINLEILYANRKELYFTSKIHMLYTHDVVIEINLEFIILFT
jgi:hypothetical protein